MKPKPIKELVKVLKNIPGFKVKLIINRMPKIIWKKNARTMGLDIAKRTAEKGVIRTVRLVAGEY